MADLRQHPTEGGVYPPRVLASGQTWRANIDPDLGYDEGDPAQEPPPPNPDKDQPEDPPPVPDRFFDEGTPAKETDPPDGDKDQPGEPPPLDVAESNGR